MDKFEDYEPLRPEWKKEVMKMTKPIIIDLLKKVIEERDALKLELTICHNSLKDLIG